MTRSVSVSLKNCRAGRTIFVADAHREDGRRFIVRADEKLTAFLELEVAIRAASWLDKPWPVKAGSVARHSQTISDGRSKLKHGCLKNQRGGLRTNPVVHSATMETILVTFRLHRRRMRFWEFHASLYNGARQKRNGKSGKNRV